MITAISKRTAFSYLKGAMGLLIVSYAIIVTIVLFRIDPKPIVIGIDPFGTRLVTAEKDPIIKAERENFIKRFIAYLYNYDETNYDERISLVGDLMNSKLWDRKKSEFTSVSTRIKQEPLTQKGKITDIRQIDDNHYEADIDVHIQSRLRESNLKLRVSLEISGSPRTTNKPYPWEVTNYDEQASN